MRSPYVYIKRYISAHTHIMRAKKARAKKKSSKLSNQPISQHLQSNWKKKKHKNERERQREKKTSEIVELFSILIYKYTYIDFVYCFSFYLRGCRNSFNWYERHTHSHKMSGNATHIHYILFFFYLLICSEISFVLIGSNGQCVVFFSLLSLSC